MGEEFLKEMEQESREALYEETKQFMERRGVEFWDAKLKDHPVPVPTYHERVPDKKIIEAVNAIYRYQSTSDNHSKIMTEILCALAHTELREPNSLEVRIFYKYAGTSDKQNSPEGAVRNKYLDLIYEHRGYHMLDLAKRDLLSECVGIISTNSKDVFQLDKTELTLEERAYIGAWAYYHLRCCVRQSDFMLENQQNNNNMSKMEKLIFFQYKFLRMSLPRLSEETFKNLYFCMATRNMDVAGVVLRSVAIETLLAETRGNSIEPSPLSVIRKFLLDQIFPGSFTLYHSALQLAQFQKCPLIVSLRHLEAQKPPESLLRSMSKLRRFYFKFVCDKKEYDSLSANYKSSLGLQSTSIFYRVSRVLSDEFFHGLGVAGNKDFINSIEMAIHTLSSDEAHLDIIDLDPYYQLGQEMRKKLGIGL